MVDPGRELGRNHPLVPSIPGKIKRTGTALRAFHTEFSESLIHEMGWGFNTENTEGELEGRRGVARRSPSDLLCALRVLSSLPQ